MKGCSLTIVIGKYGGYYWRIESMNWRLCLGWIAFTIYPKTDIEEFINHLRKQPIRPDEPGEA